MKEYLYCCKINEDILMVEKANINLIFLLFLISVPGSDIL